MPIQSPQSRIAIPCDMFELRGLVLGMNCGFLIGLGSLDLGKRSHVVRLSRKIVLMNIRRERPLGLTLHIPTSKWGALNLNIRGKVSKTRFGLSGDLPVFRSWDSQVVSHEPKLASRAE